MSSLIDASKTPAGLNVTAFTPDLRPAWMRKTLAGAPRPFQDVPVVVLIEDLGLELLESAARDDADGEALEQGHQRRCHRGVQG